MGSTSSDVSRSSSSSSTSTKMHSHNAEIIPLKTPKPTTPTDTKIAWLEIVIDENISSQTPKRSISTQRTTEGSTQTSSFERSVSTQPSIEGSTQTSTERSLKLLPPIVRTRIGKFDRRPTCGALAWTAVANSYHTLHSSLATLAFGITGLRFSGLLEVSAVNSLAQKSSFSSTIVLKGVFYDFGQQQLAAGSDSYIPIGASIEQLLKPWTDPGYLSIFWLGTGVLFICKESLDDYCKKTVELYILKAALSNIPPTLEDAKPTKKLKTAERTLDFAGGSALGLAIYCTFSRKLIIAGSYKQTYQHDPETQHFSSALNLTDTPGWNESTSAWNESALNSSALIYQPQMIANQTFVSSLENSIGLISSSNPPAWVDMMPYVGLIGFGLLCISQFLKIEVQKRKAYNEHYELAEPRSKCTIL